MLGAMPAVGPIFGSANSQQLELIMWGRTVVLSKKHALAARVALSGVELVYGQRPFWQEVTIKLLPEREPRGNGHIPQPVAVKGYARVLTGQNETLLEVQATIQLLLDPVAGFKVEYAGHEIEFDGAIRFRLRWTEEETRAQPMHCFLSDAWISSADLKRLEELPEEIFHADLYATRIRTLGHLKAWKRSQLLEATKDTQVVAGAERILAAYGATFKPE